MTGDATSAQGAVELNLGCLLGFIGEDIAHHIGGTPSRHVVVVGIPLEGERGGGVSGEGLEIAYGLAALGKEGEAAMPKVMEADRGEARPLEEPLVVAVYNVLGVEGLPVPGGEHEAPVLV